MRTFLSFLFVVASGLFIFSGCKSSPPVFSFKSHPLNDSSKNLVFMTSDYITWNEVSPMIKAYKNHSMALKTRLPDGTINVLEGLQLDADYVRAMLNDQSIRRLELFFGVNKDDLGKPIADQTFTIITAPVYFDMTKKDFMVKKYRDPSGNREAQTNSELIDFCDPCPKNCPDTTQ